MRHVKKIKFTKGRDANRALMRKLVGNLISHGKIVTTVTKAKALKSAVERLVYKAQKKTESRKNVLLSKLGNSGLVDKLFSDIAPKYTGRTGGYVRIIKLGARKGDGALTARGEWVEGKVSLPEAKVETIPQLEERSEKVEDGKKVKATKKKVSKKVTKTE